MFHSLLESWEAARPHSSKADWLEAKPQIILIPSWGSGAEGPFHGTDIVQRLRLRPEDLQEEDAQLPCKSPWSSGASFCHSLRDILEKCLSESSASLVRNKETTLVNISIKRIYGKDTRQFSESVGSEKKGGLPPAKTTAQEVFGNMWVTPPLCHLCQKWTWGVTAVNLSHSRNRALDAIAAAAAKIHSLASLASCWLWSDVLGEASLLANTSLVPTLQLLGNWPIFGFDLEGMVPTPIYCSIPHSPAPFKG